MKSKNLILGGLVVAAAGVYLYFKNKKGTTISPISTLSNKTANPIQSTLNTLNVSQASAKALEAVSSDKLTPYFSQNSNDKMPTYNTLKIVFQEYNKEDVDKLVSMIPDMILTDGHNLTFEQKIFLNDSDFSNKYKAINEKVSPVKINSSTGMPIAVLATINQTN